MTSERLRHEEATNAAGDTRAAVGDTAEAVAPAAKPEAAPPTGAEKIEAAEVPVKRLHLHRERYSNS